MPFSEPSDALTRLSPADVALAEMKAVAGAGLTKNAFFDIVRKSGLPTSDHKPWTYPAVNEAIQRLTAKRILSGDGTVRSVWEPCLVLRLARREDIATIAFAIRLAAPKSWREGGYYHYNQREWPYHDAHLDRAVRLMTLAGDEIEVEALIKLAQDEAVKDGHVKSLAAHLLADLPADPAWLESLNPPLRDRVMAAKIENLLDHGRVDAGVEAMIREARDETRDWSAAPRLDQALLRLDLLAERPDDARARIARLRTVAPVIALAAEAALIFLTDPTADSLPLFRDALKLHRKATGKRKITLPGELGHLHVMALFAANDVALHAEIITLLDAVEKNSPMVGAALTCLLNLVSGQDYLAKQRAEHLAKFDGHYRDSADPLGMAISTLALAVVDGSTAARREPQDRKAAEIWRRPTPLADRILAEVHTRFAAGDGSSPWPARLASSGAGLPRRFLDIVPIRPAWDRALDKLQGFLAPTVEGVKTAPTVQTRRLILRFDATMLQITPVEQTAKGAGWSAGRPLALKRLYQRDPKLDYFTPDDQRVLQAIKHYRTYYDDSYDFDPVRGPVALIDHPRVFDARSPDRRVDVVRYPAELVVREDKTSLHIALSHHADEPSVFIEPEGPDRWRLIEVTPALVALREILGDEGLDIPPEARDRVVALIKTDNPRLPLRSELAGVATDSLSGDWKPILQIVPDGGGFHIRAAVRPQGEAGPAYAPGQGGRSVLVAHGGAHQRIDRDLEAECAALETVAEACPALTPWRDSDHDWRIDELEAALEALQQLHAFTGPLGLEWPQGAAITPTRTVDAKAMSLNIASGQNWFEVTGQIRVDEDLVVDMAQLLARMAANPGRFVALDDGRYLALTEELRRRLDAFAAITETTKGGQRIGAVGAGALEDLMDAAGSVKADRRWSDLLKRLDAARGYEPQLPAGLDAQLRDYQWQGFAWLARLSRLGLGACLADDMGLGKTVQTLALMLSDAPKGPSLVVAPTSVCHNWVLEAARFAPTLRLHNLSTAADRAALVADLGPGDVLVASYGLLHTETEVLASRRFAVAVFDEAHNLKNAETRRARASKRIDADFRLALTGTPVENRLDELWSLFDTVTPGLLGTRESFQRRFSGPIEKGHGAPARQALKAILRPYLLRRTKAAVLSELPPRTEMTLDVEPQPAERAFYEALRRQALDSLAGGDGPRGQKRIRILAEITRLRRAACNPALIDPDIGIDSAKLAALLDLTDDLRAGRHRALVFSQFTGHLDLVEAALRERGSRVLRLDGSTPAKERARLVEAFQAGEGDLFLISLRAGGTGLNLTGADYVIHLDPWWNPAVEDQATDRAHRIGQTRPVTVYRLVVAGSIEQQILALHAAKRTLAADFLDDAQAAGALGEDELIALIRG